MTTANGMPVEYRRHPSAAFPRMARGALPLGPEARAAPFEWRNRVCRRPAGRGPWHAVILALAMVLGIPLGHPGIGQARAAPVPPTAGPTDQPRQASALQPVLSRYAVAGAPLRDAPQELLPPARDPAPAGTPLAGPHAACLAAARRAEGVHGLPPGLLVAIALSESGLHAHALSIAGRSYYPDDLATARALLRSGMAQGSTMAGCVQVNAGVHARGADWPLDAERSADWAGGMLRRWHSESGSWEAALRRWHGGSPAGTRRVLCRVRAKLEVVAPGSAVLAGHGCSGAEEARLRRSGEALLEVAEMPGR